jgi:hypothetical protein
MRDKKVVYVVSCGKVQKCQLFTPSIHAMQQKFLNIALHKQEWERWAVWICMVFGQTTIDAQYTFNTLQLSTRSDMSKDDKKDDNAPRESLTDVFVINTNDEGTCY